jgi:hypothetical protein
MRPKNARGPLAFMVFILTIVLLGAFPNARATILQVAVLLMLAIAMSELASRALPKPARRRWLLDGSLTEDAVKAHRPNDLADLERALGWRSYEAREFRNRVQPVFRELVTYRLGAKGAVPPGLTALMDDDAPAPDRVTTRDLTRLVDEIEAL